MISKKIWTRLKTRPFSLTVICKGESLTERSKSMKHKVIVNVVKENGEKVEVAKCSNINTALRFAKWLCEDSSESDETCKDEGDDL